MRIKMRNLVTFLGFAVGLFVVGDIFIFSSVGKRSASPGAQDDPYHVGNVRFLKRRIKSGRDYLSEGIKTFAEKIYEGDESTDNPTQGYDGVRDSVLGAMDVPGMQKKVLPVNMDKQALDNEMFGDLSKAEELQRDLLKGTLHNEEVAPPEPHTEEILDFRLEPEDLQTQPIDDQEETHEDDGAGLDFNWAHIFGFGKASDDTDSPVASPTANSPVDPSIHPVDAQPAGRLGEGPGWNAEDMEVPGMDSKFMSKLSFPAQEDIFQKKPIDAPPSELPAPPSEDDQDNEWLFAQLQQIKGLADSVPEWPEEAAPPVAPSEPSGPMAPLNDMDMTTPPNTHSLLAAYGFFTSLFQPLKFAGSTGDDKDDGGWASVGELDTLRSLADSVNDAMVPGMQQKLLPLQSAMMEQKPTMQEPLLLERELPSLEDMRQPQQNIEMVAIPGFENDFFNKYGQPKDSESAVSGPVQGEAALGVDKNMEVPNVPGLSADFFNKFFMSANAPEAVAPVVPEGGAGAALPAPHGDQSDLQVPTIPGLSDDFFDKFTKLGQQPPGLAPPVSGDMIEVPNIPGLTDDFFNKFRPSYQPPPEAAQAPGLTAEDIKVPNIPGLTDDFFNKYGGKLEDTDQPSPSGQPSYLAESIHVPNIPGLTDEFFNKFGVPKPSDETRVYEEAEADLEVPEVPGLSADFFNKFVHPVAKGQAAPEISMVAESLEDVPGLPADFFDKYIREKVPEEPPISAQELRDQGFDIPGLEDYLNKSLDGEELLPGEAIPVQSLRDSLIEAQLQVPGMPDKVMPDDSVGMAPGLPDVPPSEFPEMDDDDSAKSGMLAYLMRVGLGNLLGRKKPELGAGLPVLPPGFNLSMPQEPTPDVPIFEPGLISNETEEGFQMRYPSQEELDIQRVLKVLMPNISSTNDTMDLGDARSFLNQLEGFIPGMAGPEGTYEEEPGTAAQEGIIAAEATAAQGAVAAAGTIAARARIAAAGTIVAQLGLAAQLGMVSQRHKPAAGIAAQRPNITEELANITAIEESRIVECNITKSPFWKVAITDRWHTVQDGLMFVYSAYMDDRIMGHTAIRILGLLEGWEIGMHLKPFCQVWFQDKTKPFVVGATYEWLPGQPIAKFKAVLLTCVYQTSHVSGKPLAVSLTTEPCDLPKFLVKIHTRNETVGIKKTNFTICLTGPMKFGYADVGQFIQWMEFNIMMGVERFVLYNHSMDAALRPYLVHYAKMGYVQLFPWIIPENIPNPLVFLKNLGHLAMINDCLYRNMWTTNYVLFMDIDEMILPRYGHVTFAPMLKNAGCHKKPQAVVQSVFFRREWPNDELFATNQTIVNMGLVGLLKTKRERKIWPPYMRSKYFIKPDEVLICNVHAAHSFLSPLDYADLSCVFDPKEVIMHHYRYWGEVTGNYVVDRRLHEYGDDIIRRASYIYEQVLGRKVT